MCTLHNHNLINKIILFSNKNKELSIIPTRKSYVAAHILLSDLEDAEFVLNKLHNGEKFEDLAREYSECDSSQNGGSLGKFFSGDMVPEFEKALSKLNPGDISKPVKTKFGVHVIHRMK